MKISIVSPESIGNDELRHLKKALELVRKQVRSNQRYAEKLNTLVNKVEELQRKYRSQI